LADCGQFPLSARDTLTMGLVRNLRDGVVFDIGVLRMNVRAPCAGDET
jgi:hypothetical protein